MCGNLRDTEPLNVGELIVESCKQYIYLGSPFTLMVVFLLLSRFISVLKWLTSVNYYYFFLKKNNDIPFAVKKRIFDAALMSAILYGCESWLNAYLRSVTKLCNLCIKQLLGVRTTTCNDLCYVELGYPPLKNLVLSRQRKLFKKKCGKRVHMNDDPSIFAMKLTLNNRLSTRTYTSQLIRDDRDDVDIAMEKLQRDICVSDSSRRATYRESNPSLTVHDIYACKRGTREDL